MIERLLGLVEDQSEQRQEHTSRWRSADSQRGSRPSVTSKACRLASVDLLGFASRLRYESGHNLWL